MGKKFKLLMGTVALALIMSTGATNATGVQGTQEEAYIPEPWPTGAVVAYEPEPWPTGITITKINA